MKTTLRVLATISILASSVLFSHQAAAVENPYSSGNGNVACITGGQESGYFTITNNVVTGQTDCAGTATIPLGVTAIGGDGYPTGFGGARALTLVIIPNSVTAIGDWSFNDAGITSINIPDSVRTIGRGAFSSVSSLTSVNLGNGVTSIGDNAFQSTNLSSLTIPNSVTSIGEFVFGFLGGSLTANSYQYCGSALTSGDLGEAGLSGKTNSCALTIGALYNSNTRSGDVACTSGYFTIVDNVVTNYQNCVGAVNVPSGVTAIGAYAFKWATGVTSVVIPNTVTTIDVGAFEWAYQMTSLNLGNSVRSISNRAFYRADGLRSVTIPNSVTSIGNDAFYMNGLTSLAIGNSVATIGSSAFGSNNLTELNIPDSVTTIGSGAFNGMSNLASVTFGANVKTIGDYAFSQDRGITSLTIPNSVTTIGEGAFAGLSGLTSLTLGTGLVTIGADAFSQINVTSLNIPNSVTTIGRAAFSDLREMTSLTLGANVTTIGDYAFQRAKKLTSLVIPRSVTYLGANSFLEVNSFATYEYCGRTLLVNDFVNALLQFDNNGVLESQTNTCILSITTPNAPTSIVATSTGSTTASVAFIAPTDNGGSPITGYTAVASQGQITAGILQAGSGTISITGLTPGTSYTFRVVAINAIGESNLSSPSNAVPEVSSSSSSSSSSSNTATITAGEAPNSQVATFSSGVTEAVIPSSNALPAVKLSFTTTAPTSVTVVPLAANPVSVFATPFTLGSSKIVGITLSSAHDGSDVTVCLDGAATDSIFHFTGGAWVELPGRSYVNGQVCGVTNSFSPFVAAPAAPIPTPVAPMLPTDKPTVTISHTLIMCTMGIHSQTPTSAVFSLFVDGEHISTNFSAVGDYLPSWIIPWASAGTITRTASLTSATWAMNDAYKGKSITCTTLAYSAHATGLTSSEKMMVK